MYGKYMKSILLIIQYSFDIILLELICCMEAPNAPLMGTVVAHFCFFTHLRRPIVFRKHSLAFEQISNITYGCIQPKTSLTTLYMCTQGLQLPLNSGFSKIIIRNISPKQLIATNIINPHRASLTSIL